MNVVIENLGLFSWVDNALMNSKIASQGLSDNYVAGIMTHNKPELRKILLEHPEILQLKKQQLIINRNITHHEQNTTNKI